MDKEHFTEVSDVMKDTNHFKVTIEKDDQMYPKSFTEVETLIDRACKWLKEHADGYTFYDEYEETYGIEDIDKFVNDFRKAMEE